MLGTINHTSDWIWCASGKHPVAKDYFRIGPENSLLNAFSDWMGAGYVKWLGHRNTRPGHNSWRFWAKGSKKNNLICGVGKDSSDQYGRLYPLLVMGSGSLKDWESHWDLLPFALATVWEKMEYLSIGRRLADLKQLEEEIKQVPCPLNHWLELKSAQELARQMIGNHIHPATEMFSKGLCGFEKSLDCLIALSNHFASEPFKTAGMYHVLLKDRLSMMPNAVFMGGVPENARIGIFGRALAPEDFVKLWSPP